MNKLKNAFKSVLSTVGSISFIIFILIMWSAQIKSCFTTGSNNKVSGLSKDIILIETSTTNPKHQKIIERLNNIYMALNISQVERTAYFVNVETSLNAASLGNNVYILWETLANYPEWVIDAILAHEIAHDLLLHSRKMRDVDDVRKFFTEVLSLLGGADHRTQTTLQEWSSNLTLPKYSQKQEYEADKKAVEILLICGYEKSELIYANTFKYIQKNYGDSGGGFFDHHPSTEERIQEVLSFK